MRPFGVLTQLVEYLPFKQRVAGSNPAHPTIFQPRYVAFFYLIGFMPLQFPADFFYLIILLNIFVLLYLNRQERVFAFCAVCAMIAV